MSLSKEQVARYLEHINFPPSKHPSDQLTLLTNLQAHHLARVPFESVSLHYSPTRLISLDIDELFDKIVGRGRGGYCMEVNALFAAVLESLGFELISAAGKVFGGDTWSPWSHRINIVLINSSRYLVDVGYGSHTPAKPIPLIHNHEFAQIHPQVGRLERRSITKHNDPSQHLWVFSTKESPDATSWSTEYCFSELECFPEDFEAMNLFPMTSHKSFFVKNLVAARGVLDEATGTLSGMYTLYGRQVKLRSRGDKTLLQTFKTDADRVDALEKYFLIQLSPRDRRAIQGSLLPELNGY